MKNGLSKKEILRRIEQHQISSAEGLALLKALRAEPAGAAGDEALYFSFDWQEATVEVQDESTSSAVDSDLIVLWDEGERLQAELSDGMNVIRVKSGSRFDRLQERLYQLNPQQADDCIAMLEAIEAEQGRAPTMFLLHGQNLDGESSLDEQIEQQLQLGIRFLSSLSQALLRRSNKEPVRLLQLISAPPAGEAALALQAAIGGFGKTIRLEEPRLSCKVVAVQDELPLRSLIKREFALWDEQETDVRYQAGRREVKRLQRIEQAREDRAFASLRERGVYLITGGQGGLGLLFAEELVRRAKATVVLTGRSALTAEVAAKLSEWERFGAQAVYLQADIADRQQVIRLVAEIRERYGSLNGIVHSAGVVRDSLVRNKTQADWEAVLAPKLYGTVWLDEATREEELDFFVTFSSTTAVFGNVGQADYGYANAFLDRYAELRSERMKMLSINWPLWKHGGMSVSAQTEQYLRSALGMVPLSTAAGLQAFHDGLALHRAQLVVVEGNAEQIERTLRVREARPEKSMAPVRNVQNQKDLLAKTEQFLKEVLAEEMRLTVDRIDAEEALDRYGLDSVMIMNVTQKLEVTFGELSKTLFFEYQNVKELVSYLIEHHLDTIVEKFGTAAAEAPPKLIDRRATMPLPASAGRSRFFEASASAERKGGQREEDIAIIGISGRYPQARNLEEFWANLAAGRDCITEIPSDRWDYQADYSPDKEAKGKTWSKWGGFLDDVDKFDPLFFKITPREAEVIDPQERLFVETVWHTVEDAGYSVEKLGSYEVGVYVGVMYGHYQLYGAEQSSQGNSMALSSSYASIANRVSYLFNLRGPSLALDTMCSSSLTALHLACESLRRGETDVAIAGGVNLTIHPNKYMLLALGGFPSTDGRCRSFGEGGDGYVPGEGVGAVLLKPLSKALADGDRIHALIKSTSINHGGKTNGYSVPNPNAQAAVIGKAFAKAGIDPSTISYLEAHGTGTALGDPIEITGLVKAFDRPEKRGYCAIGSVKSNIGHLESAAGIAGLTKVLLQMQKKRLVPSLHSERLNPHIPFANTPFYVQQELAEWEQQTILEHGLEVKVPRRAGLSSFGAGGSNAHVILEEFTAPARQVEPSGQQLLLLSARTEEQLSESAVRLADHLAQKRQLGDQLLLGDVAYTLQVGREAMKERLAIVASGLQEVEDSLRAFVAGRQQQPVYRGSVSGLKKSGDASGEDLDRESQLRTLFREKKWSQLAELYISGVRIPWESFHLEAASTASRIGLPGYPFAKERHWFAEQFRPQVAAFATARPLHPLIDSNESTLEAQCYQKVLSGAEFYLRDHRVKGQHLLPGVVYLELARAAGALSHPKADLLLLKQVVWGQPMVWSGGPITAQIVLSAIDDRVAYEVRTSDEAGGEKLHAQGQIEYGVRSTAFAAERAFELDEIKKRCTAHRSGEDCYREFVRLGFEYGPEMQAIADWYGDRTEALSRLVLPSARAGKGEFMLDPTLLDGALQTAIGLMSGGAKDGELYLPFAIEEVEIRSDLSAVSFAHVQLMPETASQEAGVYHFQVRMFDQAGRLSVSMKNFAVRRMTVRKATDASHSDDKLLQLLRRLEAGELTSDELKPLLGGVQ